MSVLYWKFSTGLRSKVYQNQKSVFEKILVKKTVRIQANEIGVDHCLKCNTGVNSEVMTYYVLLTAINLF